MSRFRFKQKLLTAKVAKNYRKGRKEGLLCGPDQGLTTND